MSVKRYEYRHGELSDDHYNHPPAGEFVRWEDYAAATQWRPIETAPKDGTEVLLACVGHDNLKIGVKMHKEDTGSDLLNSCYVIVSSGAACQPTHWMPLPKPPSV